MTTIHPARRGSQIQAGQRLRDPVNQDRPGYEQRLNIALISPYGQARFATPAREVTDFLRRVYRIVPTARKAATSTSTPN